MVAQKSKTRPRQQNPHTQNDKPQYNQRNKPDLPKTARSLHVSNMMALLLMVEDNARCDSTNPEGVS